MARTEVIAVIFDFDDTLVPDSTSAFLESRGLDARKFWTEQVRALTDQGYDPPLAALRLLLEQVGTGKPLGLLTPADLATFGATLDKAYFPGMPKIIDDLRVKIAEFRDIKIEFYIISGGLKEIITGSSVVQKHFDGVYACELGTDDSGVVRYVKRCVTFTEKTRFIFELNKGIKVEDARSNPNLVNSQVDDADRRIPLENMVYVGDGLTDIPCFSLIRKNKGAVFGVLREGEDSARQQYLEFLATSRVLSAHSPDYRKTADLGRLMRIAVVNKAQNIEIRRRAPY